MFSFDWFCVKVSKKTFQIRVTSNNLIINLKVRPCWKNGDVRVLLNCCWVVGRLRQTNALFTSRSDKILYFVKSRLHRYTHTHTYLHTHTHTHTHSHIHTHTHTRAHTCTLTRTHTHTHTHSHFWRTCQTVSNIRS